MKFFNTAGPVNPEDHYCLPLSKRLNEHELRQLIEQKKYFILHAPRQTGKTSTILNWVKTINSEGKYRALYVNIEGGQAARANYKDALAIIIQEFETRVREQLPDQPSFIDTFKELKTDTVPAGSLLATLLSRLCTQSTKPLIIFIDEIDCLIGDTLISVLRQLRSGYDKRPDAFPQSVCLIGLRDVRDYRIWSDEKQEMVLGGSAFNIKSESLCLKDFKKEEVCDLYLQHTRLTGQKFDADAIDYAFEVTQGQPWLVNALAYQACFKDVQDRSKPITKNIIENAKETLILRQDTHLDVLIDKLREPRIRKILDTIINSGTQLPACDDDDVKYAVDLGLIKVTSKDMKIANPIYQEILPRVLANKFQVALSGRPVDYVLPNGLLDIHKLLQKFTDFYCQNSAIWLELFDYKEAGPHLLLMAFLQRIVNGEGTIHREYALGRGRSDLLVQWQTQRIVIELKIFYDKNTLSEGLEQTAWYMDVARATEGHLVIFDRSVKKSWDEKIYTRQETVGNKVITAWGM